MDIQPFGLVDPVADTVEDDVFEEALHDDGAGGDEDLCGFVAGVGGPGVRAGEGEEVSILGEGGEDFEGFGKFARFVA